MRSRASVSFVATADNFFWAAFLNGWAFLPALVLGFGLFGLAGPPGPPGVAGGGSSVAGGSGNTAKWVELEARAPR